MPVEPRRVIDLGANIGLVSLYFALRFPDAQIVAVEMMPENAAAIKRLASLNRLKEDRDCKYRGGRDRGNGLGAFEPESHAAQS